MKVLKDENEATLLESEEKNTNISLLLHFIYVLTECEMQILLNILILQHLFITSTVLFSPVSCMCMRERGGGERGRRENHFAVQVDFNFIIVIS